MSDTTAPDPVPLRRNLNAVFANGAGSPLAVGDDAYRASHIDVSGNVVTWSHLFHGQAHTCVGTDEMVVERGKIVRWDYSPIECD
jgi:hypothetical protein